MTDHELLKPEEVAVLLRTSKKAIYARAERGELPGIVRIGRTLLFRAVDIRRHLGLSTAPSSTPTSPKKVA